MKVVINTCYGGFGLSQEALLELQKIATPDSAFIIMLDEDQLLLYADKNKEAGYYSIRQDPQVVEVVEKLGNRANGRHAKLKVVEIPNDVAYEIAAYDGVEWVVEVKLTRTWS